LVWRPVLAVSARRLLMGRLRLILLIPWLGPDHRAGRRLPQHRVAPRHPGLSVWYLV